MPAAGEGHGCRRGLSTHGTGQPIICRTSAAARESALELSHAPGNREAAVWLGGATRCSLERLKHIIRRWQCHRQILSVKMQEKMQKQGNITTGKDKIERFCNQTYQIRLYLCLLYHFRHDKICRVLLKLFLLSLCRGQKQKGPATCEGGRPNKGKDQQERGLWPWLARN